VDAPLSQQDRRIDTIAARYMARENWREQESQGD